MSVNPQAVDYYVIHSRMNSEIEHTLTPTNTLRLDEHSAFTLMEFLNYRDAIITVSQVSARTNICFSYMRGLSTLPSCEHSRTLEMSQAPEICQGVPRVGMVILPHLDQPSDLLGGSAPPSIFVTSAKK